MISVTAEGDVATSRSADPQGSGQRALPAAAWVRQSTKERVQNKGNPRTFSDLEAWPEMRTEARQLEDGLENTQLEYRYTNGPKIGSSIGLPPAADAAEVRGCFMNVMYELNQWAADLGLDVECVGGGSGRSVSFTDVVLRLRQRQHSDPKHVSCSILGVGEIKGSWEFQLQRGEKLEILLQDPERIDEFILALQQAC